MMDLHTLYHNRPANDGPYNALIDWWGHLQESGCPVPPPLILGTADADSSYIGAVAWLRVQLPLYRCSSRVDLPARMKGLYTYGEAYELCCAWNAAHPAEEMAIAEPEDEAAA